MILGLNVRWIQSQFTLKLFRRFDKVAQLELNETRVKVRELHFAVERQGYLQLVKCLRGSILIVVSLGEEDMHLCVIAAVGEHLSDHLLRLIRFSLLAEGECERIIKTNVIRLHGDQFSQK